jgi:hypothetical protein
LNYFNRREIIVTMDAQKFYQITDTLRQGKIKHDYKIRNTNGSGSMSSFGLNQKYMQQYYVYVHKKDLDRAQAYLRDELWWD